mmetsp:Transcript_40927/g.89154  ORF Transcript_40927/g.89154 Transcript_40927/m.89154 type:complete len:206 (-) Transcript_40927:934-1551(-)
MLLQGVTLRHLLEPVTIILKQMAVEIVRRVVNQGAAGKQHKCHHTQGPHVHWETVDRLVVENLRSQVTIRPDKGHHSPGAVASPWRWLPQLQLGRSRAYCGAAEIDELNHSEISGSFVFWVSCKHKILQLHIPMHRVQVVNDGDCQNALLHDTLCLPLRNTPRWVVRQKIQQVGAREQLCDNVHVLGVLKELLVLQNVGQGHVQG